MAYFWLITRALMDVCEFLELGRIEYSTFLLIPCAQNFPKGGGWEKLVFVDHLSGLYMA